jgi:hypothetical protein
MKKYYNVKYSTLAIALMPVLLRGDIETALLQSLAKPLDLLNGDFGYYIRSLFTSLNAQTCNMQAMLNDGFDEGGRRITVRTASIAPDYYLLWKENRNKPVMIYKEETSGFNPYLLNRDKQTGANNIDFEIVLPEGLLLDNSELRQLKVLVNENKLASKKYRIVYE